MFVPCILAGTHVTTLFGRLTRMKTSGQAPKVLTVRQRWTVSNFQFLVSHVTIRTPHSRLGSVPIPATVSVPEVDVERGNDESDAVSVSSSQGPSQLPTSSQAAASQQPHDRSSSRSASSGKRVNDAILSLVARMSDNTAIQDRLQSVEQEAARPRCAFCQWMGLEMAKLDEPLWMDFMDDAFALVTRYKRAQSLQPPAAPPRPPPAVLQPPVQPQLQQPPVRPYSVPPQLSSSYRYQLN